MSLTHTAFVTAPNPTTNAAQWRLRLDEAPALVRLATPIALIALVNMGMSVTDTLMVSALFGTEPLAAVAVGSDLYSIVFYLSAGVLGGITPFYAAAVARADASERARLMRTAWTIVGLLTVLAVPIVWLSPLWLARIGLEPGLLQRGQGFTQAMALTLIPMLGVMLYRTVLTAAERPKVFLKVTLAMLPLNAVGNYIFMLGAGPIPALGPTGAGVSTLCVALASLAVLATIARRAAPAPATASGSGPWLEVRSLLAVLRVGIPIGIATVTELGIFLGATLYAATLGAAAVAAHTVTLRTAGVIYAIPAALLQAAMVRMARAESNGQADASRAVIVSSLLLSLVCGAGLSVLLIGSAAPLTSAFFDSSPDGITAAKLALGLLILLSVIELMINPGQAAAGLLRGRKDTRAPMFYVLFGYWAVGAPLGLYLCEMQGLGITGIWIGLAAGTAVTTVLSLARLFKRRG